MIIAKEKTKDIISFLYKSEKKISLYYKKLIKQKTITPHEKEIISSILNAHKKNLISLMTHYQYLAEGRKRFFYRNRLSLAFLAPLFSKRVIFLFLSYREKDLLDKYSLMLRWDSIENSLRQTIRGNIIPQQLFNIKELKNMMSSPKNITTFNPNTPN